MDIAAQLKAVLSLTEIITASGVKVNRFGMVACPFHGDKAPSMKIYSDKRYKCFGCGRHGDAIDYTMEFYDLSLKEACKKLDSDYGLNLYIENPTKEERLRAKRAREERLRERRRKEKREKLIDEQQRRLADAHCWFWNKTYDDEFPPLKEIVELLDNHDWFPLMMDIDQYVKMLYKRWGKIAIERANLPTQKG